MFDGYRRDLKGFLSKYTVHEGGGDGAGKMGRSNVADGY